MQSAQSDAGAPRRLGRYELLFRIAAGGMAEVYAARVSGEAGFQKLVAVKRMLPNLADDDEFVTMFLDEARLAANIESPHVVTTHDLGRAEDGSLFIAMELVVGVTLSRILRTYARRNQWVPLPIAVELLRQAAQGLEDAHQATTPVGAPLHIVHRDVSPQNILAGIDGRVRLTDFGVARAVLRMTHTVTGRVKGKFAYASPEQLAAHEIDRRSDIFSLGVVAWELFTGQRLFLGEHPVQTIERVRSMPIPAVHHARADVPAPISHLVAAALERDVQRRVPSARELATHLLETAQACGVRPVDREHLRKFIRDAGGEELEKIQSNIKRAMENRTAHDALLDIPVTEGTPSTGGTSGVMFREPSSGVTTDRVATPRAVAFPDDSASAKGPGSLIGTPQGEPAPRRRGSAAVIAVAAGVLLAVGSVVGWWLTRGDRGEVVHQLPPEVAVPSEPPPAPAPAPVEPDDHAAEPLGAAAPESATTSETAAADEQDLGAADPDPTLEADPDRRDTRRRRRRRPTRSASAESAAGETTTAASSTAASSTAGATEGARDPDPPPAQRTAGRTTTERTTTERTTTERDDSTDTSMTDRPRGFVGLDAFERGLEERR